MAAEWQLRAYRFDRRLLDGVVGCGDAVLRQQIVDLGISAGFDEDSRIGKGVTFEQIVDELIAGKLDPAHRRGYRIALEPVADCTALRLTFRTDDGPSDLLTTYAIRDDLGSLLEGVGASTLGRGWDRSALTWPWPADPPGGVDWPSASDWPAADVRAAAAEIAAARPRAGFAPRVRELVEDEFDLEDMIRAVDILVQLPALVTAPLSDHRRCVSGEGDGLLILLDGEQ